MGWSMNCSIEMEKAASEDLEVSSVSELMLVGPADLGSSKYDKIELIWPGKDSVTGVEQAPDGQWQLKIGLEATRYYPLVGFEHYPSSHGSAASLVIAGDRLNVLHTIGRSLSRSVRLAYIDAPRIGIDEASAAFRGDALVYSSWLCVMRTHLLAIEPLLRRDSVMVLHVGETEAGFARLLADELFRGQRVATIVWQRAYAPRNMRGMREFTSTHDVLLVYARERDALPPVGLRRAAAGYENPDNDPRGSWKAEHKGAKARRVKSDFDTYVPPYRWRIIEGTLPDGIWRLSPLTGVIWGTPRETGKFPITVEVSDSSGHVSTKDLVFEVLAIGDAPAPPEIPWLFTQIATSGPLRIETGHLPPAVLGHEYSAICLAAGGAPFRDNPKRPGSGRYWEFAVETLIRAYQQDAVYLGRDKPTAIPHPKSYAPEEGELVVENQQTWWPGRVQTGAKTSTFTGFTEDATKHLKALKELGLIEIETSSAKPEHLLARLIDIFTDRDDIVLEVFGSSADLAAVAIKRQRRFLLLAGSSNRDLELLKKCSLPRLKAVVDGKDTGIEDNLSEIRMRPDAYIPYEGGGTFSSARIGEWLLGRHVRDDLPGFNWKAFVDPTDLRSALLTTEGFMPATSAADYGISFRDLSAAAVVLPGDEYLTMEVASHWIARLSGQHPKLILYYFRASAEFDPKALPSNIVAKRVPFDLGV